MNLAAGAAGERYRHRRATATVTLVDGRGDPLRGAAVEVEQLGHAFLFGNIGFDFIGLANGETEPAGPRSGPFGGAPADAARILEPLFLDVFNAVTLPFYWGGFEPERGHPQTRRILAAARWFAERGVLGQGPPARLAHAGAGLAAGPPESTRSRRSSAPGSRAR